MALAEGLGKFEHEILALSPTEYARWLAYFNIKAEAAKRDAKRAKRGKK